MSNGPGTVRVTDVVATPHVIGVRIGDGVFYRWVNLNPTHPLYLALFETARDALNSFDLVVGNEDTCF